MVRHGDPVLLRRNVLQIQVGGLESAPNAVVGRVVRRPQAVDAVELEHLAASLVAVHDRQEGLLDPGSDVGGRALPKPTVAMGILSGRGVTVGFSITAGRRPLNWL